MNSYSLHNESDTQDFFQDVQRALLQHTVSKSQFYEFNFAKECPEKGASRFEWEAWPVTGEGRTDLPRMSVSTSSSLEEDTTHTSGAVRLRKPEATALSVGETDVGEEGGVHTTKVLADIRNKYLSRR